MPEHPRKSSKKKAASKTTAPLPTAGASTAAAVAAAKRTRKAKFAMPVVPPSVRDERLPPEERDFTEPDDIEIWMAEQLRDWQLLIGAATLDQLLTVMGSMLSNAKEQRAAVRNDLRQEGYLEGQINVLETITQQVQRAVAARKDRIGEAVHRDGP